MDSEEKPTGAPLIGEFSGPRGNKPRTSQRVDDEVKALEDLQRNVAEEDPPVKENEKTPEETYKEQLKKNNLTLEKARLIRDNMLFEHFHEETYLLGNKLPVVLRTRDYGDAQRAMRKLESESPAYAMSINDLIAHCNMAASLSKYGKTSFQLFTPADKATDEQREDSFEERSRFLVALPTTLVDSLMRYAEQFDAMIAAVFATGAPEDF